MDNNLLNRCITQGNNLAQVCTALHQRLVKVEDQNKKLVELNTALLKRIVSHDETATALLNRIITLENTVTELPDRIDAITAVVNETKVLVQTSSPKPKASSKRIPRTYDTYQKVMKAQAGGMSMKLIAQELGIPYTTVVSYFKMSQDEIDALPRDEQEPDDATISEPV